MAVIAGAAVVGGAQAAAAALALSGTLAAVEEELISALPWASHPSC